MQTYANLKVFPLQQRMVWAGNIMTPVWGFFSNDQMTRWKKIQPKAVGGGMKCPALGWTQLAGGGGEREGKLTTTHRQPKVENQLVISGLYP